LAVFGLKAEYFCREGRYPFQVGYVDRGSRRPGNLGVRGLWFA